VSGEETGSVHHKGGGVTGTPKRPYGSGRRQTKKKGKNLTKMRTSGGGGEGKTDARQRRNEQDMACYPGQIERKCAKGGSNAKKNQKERATTALENLNTIGADSMSLAFSRPGNVPRRILERIFFKGGKKGSLASTQCKEGS